MGEKSVMDPYVPFAQFQELLTQDLFFFYKYPHLYLTPILFWSKSQAQWHFLCKYNGV